MIFPAIHRCNEALRGTKKLTKVFLEVHNMFHFSKAKSLGMILLILVLAAAIYAFAAANTFADDTYAGAGSTTISGYTIRNIHYTLDTASDPRDITQVQFDIDENGSDPPSTVYITLDGGTTWQQCSAGAGAYDWDCDLSSNPADVETATALEIVAAE
jgi:hypothetical protein